MEEIRQREVLNVVLLRTLASAPDGMLVSDVNDAIAAQYTFPEEWYRELPDSHGYETLKGLGYSDWRKVKQEKLIELVKTEPQWKNEIRWARNELRKRGYLDASAPRGIWRLTSEGMTVAADPEAHINLSEREREIATPKPTKPAARSSTEPPEPTKRRSQRDRLVAMLLTLTEGLPIAELELVVDLARVVRRRNLPDEAPDGDADS
jgi:restriction endonuclease Mrr